MSQSPNQQPIQPVRQSQTVLHTSNTKNNSVNKLGLHANADELIHKLIDKFTVTLVYQAKINAYKDGADEVQSPHVNDAYDQFRKDSGRSWLKELSIAIGSAFFGAFIPAFLENYYSQQPISSETMTYTILGFAGIIMVAWGLKRGK